MAKKNSLFVRQYYRNYTQDDQYVWSTLFNKQYSYLKEDNKVINEYFEGLNILNITDEKIPKFSEINKILKKTTGWVIKGVDGLIDDDVFFELLRKKIFPVTTWIRNKENINYIEEPDLFHDLFGHVPFLVNKTYVNFLSKIAKHAKKIYSLDDKERQHMMSRLYWYTIEFGLVRIKSGKYRIYGSGIISSYDETTKVMSNNTLKKLFNYDILSEEFYKHDLQEYYVSINKHIKFLSKLDMSKI